MAGSRMLKLPEARSIFARSVMAPFGELTGPHAAEEVKRLLDGTVAVRAAGGGRQVAAVFAHLLGRQLADIGQTLAG